VPRNVVFFILATQLAACQRLKHALSGQFRLTILPKQHHGESLGVCELFT